jgi:hypothetical protein
MLELPKLQPACLAPVELFLCRAVAASSAESWQLGGRQKLLLATFLAIYQPRVRLFLDIFESM